MELTLASVSSINSPSKHNGKTCNIDSLVGEEKSPVISFNVLSNHVMQLQERVRQLEDLNLTNDIRNLQARVKQLESKDREVSTYHTTRSNLKKSFEINMTSHAGAKVITDETQNNGQVEKGLSLLEQNSSLMSKETLHTYYKHNFSSIWQCFFMAAAIAGMVICTVVTLVSLVDSYQSEFKPYKVSQKRNYYMNEDLNYSLPWHYFWFDLYVNPKKLSQAYREKFNTECDRHNVTECLLSYLNDFRDQNEMISANCSMHYIDSDNGTLTTEVYKLNSNDHYIDELGINTRLEARHVVDSFGFLWRMGFEDIDNYMKGKLMCEVHLDIEVLDKMLLSFAEYDIYFLVSRDNYDSGTIVMENYIRAMKLMVKRNREHNGTTVFNYIYAETTLDGVSDFQAEVYMEYTRPEGHELIVETYPYPIVVQYQSYENYGIQDWVADFGGFSTLFESLFLFGAIGVIKLTNRDKKFVKSFGILPSFSRIYRNAEEMAELRLMILTCMGMNEEQYGDKMFVKAFTTMMGKSENLLSITAPDQLTPISLKQDIMLTQLDDKHDESSANSVVVSPIATDVA